MVCENNLTKYFWAEAINTTCYILNRALIRPIHKKTPYELWHGWKPNISYFHVFGCKFFVHNNGKDNLEKFYAKADEGIFLGYSTTSKAYKIFNRRSLIVEESIHVVFDESMKHNSKKFEEEGEEINKHSETKKHDTQTRINNEEENVQEEDPIEP